MPAANPLLHVPSDAGSPADSAYYQQAASPSVTPQHSYSGTGPGPDVGDVGAALNTNVHVGVAVIAALAVVILLHLGGFRFAFDVGLGRK